MMDALGFPGLIDGGQTTAEIDAIWPGPPSAFALAKLETGAITLKVAEGRILEVEPGVGRFFGLLSLSEIPRRLSLDFSDFFRSGLSFNSITGTFGLDKGNAYTSNLVIKSPAADIAISGRTGLRAKDYDQEMRRHAAYGRDAADRRRDRRRARSARRRASCCRACSASRWARRSARATRSPAAGRSRRSRWSAKEALARRAQSHRSRRTTHAAARRRRRQPKPAARGLR